MIRSIYFERYKKVLIAACLLVIATGIFNAVIENNQWKNTYNDPYNKENFEQHREDISYWDDEEEKNITFTSFAEYQKYQLMFYSSPLPYYKTSKASDYSADILYRSNFSTYFISALSLIVPLAGFLCFFIDQKTGFNHFLFSLGISRKELFKKKIVYLGLPFLVSILIGQSLYVLLIHWLIPAPYMNATLEQLFTSMISNFSLLFFLLCVSVFIGSMVGNVFFGPLTLGVFLFLMSWLPDSIYSLGNIIKLANGTYLEVFPRTLFVDSVGKTGGNIWTNLIMTILSLLLIFWAYKKYQTLSLENDNAYLLHKESRWPIWAIMTIFTSFILNTNILDPWFFFLQRRIYDHATDSISGPIISNLVVSLIVGGICLIIVFFKEVSNILLNTLNKLNQRMG